MSNSLRRARVALLGTGMALALATCSPADPFEPLPVPEDPPAPTTSTTAPADVSGVALAPVEGTTTTAEVAVGPGPSTLAGRVDGPDGPVEGAVVRLERLVGDTSASLDVTSGVDGGWRAGDVLGGRYRVRAWRAPDLAMIEPQILFVEAGRTAELALALERFQASAVDVAIAPDPPPVGVPVNLVVRVSSQVVDDDGVVRATPQANVPVTIGVGNGWDARSSTQAPTDEAGAATFTLACRAPGPQPLMVTLPPRPPVSPPPPPPGEPSGTGPAPEVLNLDLPDCVPPPAPPAPAPDPAESGPSTTGDS